MSSSAFDELCSLAREAALVESVEAALGWDERTYMPPAAGEYRAEQMTFLRAWRIKQRTSQRLGELLGELAGKRPGERPAQRRGGDDPRAEAAIRQAGQAAAVARRGTDAGQRPRPAGLGQGPPGQRLSPAFAPHVEKLFHLKRQQAECLGYDDSPYDALLDDFEPDAKTADVAQVLAGLRAELVPLVQAIMQSGRKAPVEILQREYPAAAQEAFGKAAAAAIGFDFDRGRLDVTHHPFCSGMGPHDCRITTRYDERFFNSAFFGILHEAGHGIYDQGLRPEQFGLPPGTYVSLGIHESQSRMWENLVGRSRAFWQHFFPQLQAAFPAAVGDVKLDDFFFAINHVAPSLIRVEADEATYNLHIILRFELEQALLDRRPGRRRSAGGLDAEVPAVPGHRAADRRRRLPAGHPLVRGPDRLFPDLLAGQPLRRPVLRAGRPRPGRPGRACSPAASSPPLKSWLNEKIHHRGQCYTAAELVQLVTGQPLSPRPAHAAPARQARSRCMGSRRLALACRPVLHA